jgi:hypothetical protein
MYAVGNLCSVIRSTIARARLPSYIPACYSTRWSLGINLGSGNISIKFSYCCSYTPEDLVRVQHLGSVQVGLSLILWLTLAHSLSPVKFPRPRTYASLVATQKLCQNRRDRSPGPRPEGHDRDTVPSHVSALQNRVPSTSGYDAEPTHDNAEE